ADTAAQREAERFLDDLQANSSPVELVFASRDLEHFQGCWRTEQGNGEAVDWFAKLGARTAPRAESPIRHQRLAFLDNHGRLSNPRTRRYRHRRRGRWAARRH